MNTGSPITISPSSSSSLSSSPFSNNSASYNANVLSSSFSNNPSLNMISPLDPQTIPEGASKILTIGNFKLGKTIGIGSFGKVKLAEHIKTGDKVAVKILNRKKISSLRMDLKIRREITNMKLFRHPHIIRLYQVIETKTDIFMIMEYVSGGELFDFIVTNGKLPEDTARRYFQQIISGVEYCHNHMVVHRDLKPENLLLDTKRNCVKIADFGLSTMMQDGEFLKTSCGSPNYAAPEVISGKLYAGPEVDVWSCGVILYTLLCARLPFDDDYIPNLFKKIRSGIFDLPSFLSQGCKELIKAMLEVDPLKRITIEEIRRHPWFKTNLPTYLAEPSSTCPKIKDLDLEIVEEIAQKFQEDKSTVIAALQNSENNNEFLVAYHLIEDNKRMFYFLSNGATPSDQTPSQLVSSPSISLREELPFEFEDEFNLTSKDISSTISKKENNRQMWYLGINSSLHPEQIMDEVYRALKIIGFKWKIIGPYALRCKITDNSRKEKSVTLALQVFKVKESRYLLDIKKSQETHFICSMFVLIF